TRPSRRSRVKSMPTWQSSAVVLAALPPRANSGAPTRRSRSRCWKPRPLATAPGYIRRLQHDVALMKSLGFSGIEWIGRDEVRSRVNSERYLGAMWEPRLVLVNPAQLVREDKRIALEAGASVYEETPVLEITSRPNFRLTTPGGAVNAAKLVFATNAYSHFFPELKRKQVPAFTYMIATEPLSAEQLAPIGWSGLEGIEDARNLIHYYRLTPDHRLAVGGGPGGATLGVLA